MLLGLEWKDFTGRGEQIKFYRFDTFLQNF